MSSKFERDLLLPAYQMVQEAAIIENDAGTQYRLGFQQSLGDENFAGVVGVSAELSGDCGNIIHSMLRWHDGGCPRFKLTHGLTTHFALTDPVGISMSEIRQPFPTYVVELPRPNGPIVWDAENIGVNDKSLREPAYLIVHTNLVDSEPHTPNAVLAETKSLPEILSIWSGWRDRPQRPMLTVHIFDGFGNTVSFLTHGDFIDTDVVEPFNRINSHPSPAEPGQHAEGSLTMAWRIAFNLPLYLKHRPSSATTSGKIVNHDHGMRSTLYELGADVPLNRDLRDAARAACSGERGAKSWAIAQRFIVRGHWKMQPHGPGRSERKMIFVEPYWKGAADAPLVTRAYTDRAYDGAGGDA